MLPALLYQMTDAAPASELRGHREHPRRASSEGTGAGAAEAQAADNILFALASRHLPMNFSRFALPSLIALTCPSSTISAACTVTSVSHNTASGGQQSLCPRFPVPTRWNLLMKVYYFDESLTFIKIGPFITI